MPYLIDGYNVVHASIDRPIGGPLDLDSARDNLIERTAQFCAVQGETATLVFDGRGRVSQRELAFKGFPNLEVVFAAGNRTADTYIERAVYRAASPRDIIVVTGDRGIRDLCLGFGALTMVPRDFIEETERARQASIPRPAPQGQYSWGRLEERIPQGHKLLLEALRNELDRNA